MARAKGNRNSILHAENKAQFDPTGRISAANFIRHLIQITNNPHAKTTHLVDLLKDSQSFNVVNHKLLARVLADINLRKDSLNIKESYNILANLRNDIDSLSSEVDVEVKPLKDGLGAKEMSVYQQLTDMEKAAQYLRYFDYILYSYGTANHLFDMNDVYSSIQYLEEGGTNVSPVEWKPQVAEDIVSGEEVEPEEWGEEEDYGEMF